MGLALYVGFSRLNHLRFLERAPMLVGILKVWRLPPQCTFWRFLASLHLGIAQQLLEVQRRLRQRGWEAAHVRLRSVTLGVSYSDHYVEQGVFQRLMQRLRAIGVGPKGYGPVLAVALRS